MNLFGKTELPGNRNAKAENTQALRGVKSLCELCRVQEPEIPAMCAS
jgi:hypothetical protein